MSEERKWPSPFTKPIPGVTIHEGTPPVTRPTKEEVAAFPEQAKVLLDETWAAQQEILGQKGRDLSWMAGKHFLLAGATGPGLGGALATAIQNSLPDTSTLTVVGRDLSRSLGYQTGHLMQTRAEAANLGRRFHWLNVSMDLDGKGFQTIVAALQDAGAERIIYVNTVAAASSGLLPGAAPVYIPDVDQNGLCQWQLPALDERAIATTKFVMGELAVKFVDALEAAGIAVELAVFADWRGSLDHISRDPSRPEYGRQGSYSTSLYLPKDIIQEAVSEAYRSSKKMIDIFYPVMRTRALGLIPGGTTMSYLYAHLMRQEGIRRIDLPELALNTLQVMGQVLTQGYDNPFPRLDAYEMPLDEWFYEVLARLNNDQDSDFYYKRWWQIED